MRFERMPPSEFRPLVQLVPSLADGAAVFADATRDIRVEGDVTLLAKALALCDGTRSAEEIATSFGDEDAEDIAELITALAENGVLVDCTEAHRRFHWQSGTESPLFRVLPDEQIIALVAERFRPDGLTDRSVVLEPPPSPLRDLTARRASSFAGERSEVSFADLSGVLAAMYRLGPRQGRPVPSAGAVSPLILHVALREPAGPLEPGLWWYDPDDTSLHILRADDGDLESIFVNRPESDALLEARQPAVFISADLERASRKYSNRGYRYALMEAGAAMQNAYLSAAELGVPIRAIGGIADEATHRYLGLPEDAAPLLALLLGS